MKISVFYMNCYQTVTLAEHDFHNLVDSMIHPWVPVRPIIAQWAHEQNEQGWRL